MEVRTRLCCFLLVIGVFVVAEEVVQLDSLKHLSQGADFSDAPDTAGACKQCHLKCGSVQCGSWCNQNWCNKGKQAIPHDQAGQSKAPVQHATAPTPDEQAQQAIETAESVIKGGSAASVQSAPEHVQTPKDKPPQLAKQNPIQTSNRSPKNEGNPDTEAENAADDATRKEQEQKKKDLRVQNKKFRELVDEATEPAAVRHILDDWKMVRKGGVQTAEPLNNESAEHAKPQADKNAASKDAATQSDTKEAGFAACKACVDVCKTNRCRSWCRQFPGCTDSTPQKADSTPQKAVQPHKKH